LEEIQFIYFQRGREGLTSWELSVSKKCFLRKKNEVLASEISGSLYKMEGGGKGGY